MTVNPILYAVGSDPAYYYTRAAIRSSTDLGNTWPHTHVLPFPTREGAQYLIRGLNQWLCLSDAGGACVSVSDSLDVWGTPYKFQTPPAQLLSGAYVAATDTYVVVGWVTNPSTLTEQAVCMTSQLGVDASSWRITYLNPNGHSGLRSMCADPVQGDLFAVGHTHGDRGHILWSGDAGDTWQQIALPPELDGPLFHVSGTRSLLRIGSVSQVVSMTWTGSQAEFQGSQTILNTQGARKSITWVQDALQPDGSTHTVACMSDQILFSTNGVDYETTQVSAYTMLSGAHVQGDWVLGGHGLLNEYSGFKVHIMSQPDPQIDVTAYQSHVHAKQILVR